MATNYVVKLVILWLSFIFLCYNPLINIINYMFILSSTCKDKIRTEPPPPPNFSSHNKKAIHVTFLFANPYK